MPSLWRNSALAALLIAVRPPAAAQTPGRVTYDVRVIMPRARAETVVVARGRISEPEEAKLRLELVSDAARLDALLGVVSQGDTVELSGGFNRRLRAGRSARGLPLWEVDDYHRSVRLPWGGTARLYPFGPPQSAQSGPPVWLAITVTRDRVAGDTRPLESVVVFDSTVHVTMEAIVHPRRAAVRVTLLRGDSSSAPKLLDMVTDGPSKLVTFVLGRNQSTTLDVALRSPGLTLDPADSTLARDADVVCLRVTDPDPSHDGAAHVRCGRVNNVARTLPLSDGDTIVTTFSWPVPR
ncbi:MAG TPA: hypothetical protein VLV45_03665 [Gemmatimonadales bacterium]|nr:hypothetical protein [Gemmatimonadales bacterium]